MEKKTAESISQFINECKTQSVGTDSTDYAKVVILDNDYAVVLPCEGGKILRTEEEAQSYTDSCPVHPNVKK